MIVNSADDITDVANGVDGSVATGGDRLSFERRRWLWPFLLPVL